MLTGHFPESLMGGAGAAHRTLRFHPITRMRVLAFLLSLQALIMVGCSGGLVNVEVAVVDEKTALERQVLGTYEEISSDVILLASVRAIDSSGKLTAMPDMSGEKREVIKAIQSREFNKDDIMDFKKAGLAGENNRGYLTFLPPEGDKLDPQREKFVKAIIEEENRDRGIIMERVLAVNVNFREGDMEKVEKIFAALNRDNAQKGDLIQMEDGTWVKKD